MIHLPAFRLKMLPFLSSNPSLGCPTIAPLFSLHVLNYSATRKPSNVYSFFYLSRYDDR